MEVREWNYENNILENGNINQESANLETGETGTENFESSKQEKSDDNFSFYHKIFGGDFIKIIIGTNQTFYFKEKNKEKNEEKNLINNIHINEEEEELIQFKKLLKIKKKYGKFFQVENNNYQINNNNEKIKLINIEDNNKNNNKNNINNIKENKNKIKNHINNNIIKENNNIKEKNGNNKENENKLNNKEEKENILNENFIQEGKEFIKKCLANNELKNEEVQELKKIFSEILKINFKNIEVKEEKKLNLVIDLDKTLIYVTQIKEPDKFKEKEDVIKCEFLNENLSCSFRKRLKKFFSHLKKFYKFYIYTTSLKEYAKYFSSLIEKTYGIKFEKIFYKITNKKGMKKRLNTMNLSRNNSIIFDDKIDVWDDDYENVIVSKRFLDDFNCNEKQFSNEFEGICYNKIKSSLQYKTNETYNNIKCFILNENRVPLNIELNNEKQKNQLDYLIPFYQLIFVLYNKFEINVVDSIKLIRPTIFSKCIFDISNSHLNDKNNLKDMILTLGGTICNYEDRFSATHIVINKSKIIQQKKSINDFKQYHNAKLINLQFIFDSFFFYNKMNENEQEYKIFE